MIAILPTTIPQEPGACVVRVFEPLTPRERQLSESARILAAAGSIPPMTVVDGIGQAHLIGVKAPAVWRVFFWQDGRAFLSSVMQPELPTLAAIMRAHAEFPLEWSELIRAKGEPLP